MTGEVSRVKFDLHCHTDQSDGKNTLSEMVLRGQQLGLNYLAITDHNYFHPLSQEIIDIASPLSLIPGCELSFNKGHFLILGIDPELGNEKLKSWGIKKGSPSAKGKINSIEKKLEWAIDNEALVIAAHPCISAPFEIMSLKKKHLITLYQEGLIHGVEVHNGGFYRRLPKKVYQHWHKHIREILSEYDIPAFSNSDAHSSKYLANRYNISEIVGSQNNPQQFISDLKERKLLIITKKG